MPDLQPGVVFAGHRIEGVAGRGGMGTVYRATHIALDHVVALKVISADLAADDAFRERFRSESRIAVSLRHPNVVPIHHAGEEDGLLFVTMDLIDGPDLRRMLIAGGTLAPDRAIPIVGQVAGALDVAHARGLVHRDIKPGNILVERDSDDRAYLTDFGLAKRFDQATEAGALTRTGAFVGTLDYVAPEQIRGDRVDARTDVYALGCVMYEAISGRAPFADREENVAKIYAHLQDEPPWLPGESGAESALDEVIARALAKDPGDRYPSAGDLARAAAAAIEGHEVLRSAERSVATGKAAPETGEPAAPPIPDTVASDAPPAPLPPPDPPPTEPMSAVPETTAEHPGPTRVVEPEEGGPPGGGSPPAPRATATTSGGPRWGRIGLLAAGAAAVVVAAVVLLGGGGDEPRFGERWGRQRRRERRLRTVEDRRQDRRSRVPGRGLRRRRAARDRNAGGSAGRLRERERRRGVRRTGEPAGERPGGRDRRRVGLGDRSRCRAGGGGPARRGRSATGRRRFRSVRDRLRRHLDLGRPAVGTGDRLDRPRHPGGLRSDPDRGLGRRRPS